MAPSVIAVLARLFVAVAPQPVDDWDDQPDPSEPGIAIEGRALPSLVEIESITVEVRRPDDAEDLEQTVLHVSADLVHDLDATITSADLAIALLPDGELDFVWTRLTTPPLAQLTSMLQRAMPASVAVVVATAPEDEWTANAAHDVAAEEVLYEALQPASLRYLAAMQNLTLASPSAEDARRILEGGGPAELAALARWATDAIDTQPFADAACRSLMEVVDATVRRMRAPPGFGDHQRLSAAAAVAVNCAGPSDLDRALALQRPITILMSSAELTHHSALADEAALAIEVHGLGPSHARSGSALAWEAMLARLRKSALDRLLRLAAEPADFRGAEVAPPRRAPLRVAAIALLSPMVATEVDRAMSLASERPETQREILRFYVDMRHAPAIEPLVDWLTEHPEHIDDLGTHAVTNLGDAMIGVLVRRFDDPDATPDQRAATWRLLAMLPEAQAGPLLAMVAALGVDVSALSSVPTIADVVQRLMQHERALDEERVENLVAVITGDAQHDLMEKVRTSKRLTELSPERAAEVGEAIIAAHVAAAHAIDIEAEGERRAILGQLSELPLGDMSRRAVYAAVVTDGEIALARQRLDHVFEILERLDPALSDEGVRSLYEKALRARWDEAMTARDWPLAEATIAKAERTVADAIDIDEWRTTLEQRRGLPLRILAWSIAGALTLVALYALHAFGLTAAIRRRIAERDARRAELSRQWEPDVVEATHEDDANASDVAPSENAVDEREHTGAGDDGEAIADSWSARSHDEHRDVGEHEPLDEVDRSPLDDFAA